MMDLSLQMRWSHAK